MSGGIRWSAGCGWSLAGRAVPRAPRIAAQQRASRGAGDCAQSCATTWPVASRPIARTLGEAVQFGEALAATAGGHDPAGALAGADEPPTTKDGKSAATATSAADFGGMDALVAAADKEGKPHIIAVPRDWANRARRGPAPWATRVPDPCVTRGYRRSPLRCGVTVP